MSYNTRVKITILQVGKTKEKAYQTIENEFLKRLKPFAQVESVVIKTSNIDTENEELQKRIPKEHLVVAMDRRGSALTSEQFAEWLEMKRDFEGGKVAFMIGGPQGFTNETLSKANVVLSLSNMTFTHQMVRLFLLEQLYRGFTIITGKTYHY